MAEPKHPLEDVDDQVRILVDRGDSASAAALLLSMYGADLFGFLIGVLEDVKVARRVYMTLCERVPRSLATFQWRCAPRVWLYSLARRELRDRRERRRGATSSGASATDARRRAALATLIVAVRSALSEDERELLILRVDRVLDWQSLAITQLGETARTASLATEARTLQRRIDGLIARIQRLTTIRRRVGER